MATKILWEAHDEDDAAFMSKCGRFEASPDPVYGYFRLYANGDTTESLAEARSPDELADLAADLVDSGQVL